MEKVKKEVVYVTRILGVGKDTIGTFVTEEKTIAVVQEDGSVMLLIGNKVVEFQPGMHTIEDESGRRWTTEFEQETLLITGA